MSPAFAADMIRYALRVALETSSPLLAAMTVTALILGILQAATQINDSSISFTPKLAVALVIIWVTSTWFSSTLAAYTAKVLTAIPGAVAR
jgi:flagellar biosynthetic protein FliQ